MSVEMKELKASGSLNRDNYDHYVGFNSRSKVEKVTDSYGSETTTTTHYHGAKVAGQVVVDRGTGRTQYFIRKD